MRTITHRLLILMVLAVLPFATAAYAQEHRHGHGHGHGHGEFERRELQAVLTNLGRVPHNFQLRDDRNQDNKVYTVNPGQNHATRHSWYGETSVYVDGKYAGKLREIGHVETGTNGPVWMLDLHGVGHH